MKRRNESEIVKISFYDIIYSVEFWGIFISISIMFAAILHNYLPLSCMCFAWVKFLGNEKEHFFKNKLTQFILRKYLYTTKLVISLFLVFTIILSCKYFGAFICSVLLSIVWAEYMKLFKKQKRKA